MNRCNEHIALRTRVDRNGMSSLSPAERGVLAKCPCCGPEIVAVQDALGDLVELASLEPDLEDEDDNRRPTIPIDTSGPPNAWMREIATPERTGRDISSVISAAIVLLLAAIAAIVV